MCLTKEEYKKCVSFSQDIYKKRAHGLQFMRTSSGLKAYIKEESDAIYVVFAGTTFWSLRDWLTNFKIFFGIKPKQFYEALEFVSRNFKQDKRMIICGHSLAGAITTYIANNIHHDNFVAVTFNGCGVRHIVDPIAPNNIYHFITSYDILNRFSEAMPNGWLKHIGYKYYVEDKFDLIGIKSHSNWKAFEEVYDTYVDYQR